MAKGGPGGRARSDSEEKKKFSFPILFFWSASLDNTNVVVYLKQLEVVGVRSLA